ncbi:hypothetical protein cyc_05893 [Cyclospora cayetanensis]|uniref:Uncharacterized protein n=1 Tax=Cyclospora cayetanensis TaxID=88456 RepID=A0A1D3D7E6_9EIME|nr:hypothetical protein cyc_05893 [Cyclospora cayetanensis]
MPSLAKLIPLLFAGFSVAVYALPSDQQSEASPSNEISKVLLPSESSQDPPASESSQVSPSSEATVTAAPGLGEESEVAALSSGRLSMTSTVKAELEKIREAAEHTAEALHERATELAARMSTSLRGVGSSVSTGLDNTREATAMAWIAFVQALEAKWKALHAALHKNEQVQAAEIA